MPNPNNYLHLNTTTSVRNLGLPPTTKTYPKSPKWQNKILQNLLNIHSKNGPKIYIIQNMMDQTPQSKIGLTNSSQLIMITILGYPPLDTHAQHMFFFLFMISILLFKRNYLIPFPQPSIYGYGKRINMCLFMSMQKN